MEHITYHDGGTHEQQLRENTTYAALAEIGRLDLVTEVEAGVRGTSMPPWNTFFPSDTSQDDFELIHRATAIGVAPYVDGKIACLPCFYKARFYEDALKICTHQHFM